jgi:PAS domain S-box-containing protein
MSGNPKAEDEVKTRQQLIGELARLRRRVAELEKSEAEMCEKEKRYAEELKKHLADCEQIGEALKESETRFRTLVERIPNAVIYIAALDAKSTTLYVSPQIEEVLGYTQKDYEDDPDIWRKSIHPDDYNRVMAEVAHCHEGGEPLVTDYRIIRKDGGVIWFHDEADMVRSDTGKPLYLLGINMDISKRRLTEETLRQRENELVAKSRRLEELNSALKVLLKTREDDKTEIEARVTANVKDLVLPTLERLKNSQLDSKQRSLVGMLESNLREIVSPFATKLSSRLLNLTTTEIQVASMIKDGRTTKEIAKLLHLSENTIQSHRYHIRQKLGLVKRKANLRTHLRNFRD